jgi:two-component system LytT family response regulator
MNQLTCIIVDDEPQNQRVLEIMIDQFCPDVRVLAKASSVSEAVELISKHSPNIVFLDVEMPNGNGFTLFEKIPNPNFFVVFTTAHADYAIKAIKFAALDYLLKPISLGELKVAIQTASLKMLENGTFKKSNAKRIDVLNSNNESAFFNFKKIALPTQEGIDFFKLRDILRCEADRAYCRFYLVGGKKILVSNSLKEYETIMESANFFRVHKSNMVNVNHITKYIKGNGGQVILTDNSLINVAVRKKDELLKILANK